MGWIAARLLRLWGWKVVGDFPLAPVCVIAVVPHTSALDFPLGLLLRSSLRSRISYIGKKSLFRPPLGWITRATGGIPVDRTRNTRFVDAVVAQLRSADEMRISMSPEGTRDRVEQLKTGFYHIARLADVPLYLCLFDFKNKIVDFGGIFPMTGDIDTDMPKIYERFRGVEGYHPERSFDAVYVPKGS